MMPFWPRLRLFGGARMWYKAPLNFIHKPHIYRHVTPGARKGRVMGYMEA